MLDRITKEATLKTEKKSEATPEKQERPVTWTRRGGTYVPLPKASNRGLGRLDEDRADSMTDEGGPPRS